MTRVEEKLYLQSVFDAIDEVYKMNNHQQTLTYEERLRASFNKLLIPDWYNHDYTSINGLRKTKSHGQVSRTKRYDNNHNHYQNGTSDALMSSSNHSPHLSNGTYRYRTPSHSWSERPPLRRNSTTSSYDTNGSVIINGRRSINSNGTPTYAPGVQRVAQSSTWYKPKTFTIKSSNGHAIVPPKPLPRYSKMDQDRINSTDFSLPLSTSKSLIATPIPNATVRHPIKPRTMAQVPIPKEQIDEESSLLNVSSDGDITVLQKPTSSRTTDISSLKYNHASPTPQRIVVDTIMSTSMTTDIPRTDSMKSFSSDAESYRSALLPPLDKNLLVTDSSSYASVNDQCLSTSSYHTAIGGDSSSSSATGYETPTPQLDDETLSSHSSVSDLSFAETLEPNTEDLDIIVVLTEEQKSAIIPSVDVGMENLPLPAFPSTISNTASSSPSDHSPSTESRPIDNANWYDDGSIETCIHQTSAQLPTIELREISNTQNLHEVDMNGAGDEFFLFSPRNTNEDELSSSISDDKHEQDFEQLESPIQTSKRIYTMEDKNINVNDDFTLTDDFHCSSTVDPFGFNNNNSSIMITNLDDILIDDDDDDDGNDLKDKSTYLLNTNYRRPIQEDILYEVEHENSFSDHSQNTSSIIIADDNNTSIKRDPILDFLTSSKEPIKTDIYQSTLMETTAQEKQSKSNEVNSLTKQSNNDTNTLPIYILPPPLYASTSNSLRIDTSTNPYPYKLDLSTSSSPSSYTSKIRNRHYSVGSYYDNKTTTVTITPNNTLYIIGSAPVSPLSRTSTTSSESHYHLHHHSPVAYGNMTLNALRRVNPFLETNTYVSNYEHQRSPSLNRDDYQRSPSLNKDDHQATMPIHQTEPIIVAPRSLSSPPSTHTSSAIFSQYDKQKSTSPSSPPLPPIPSPKLEQELPLVRPKTSRGRVRSPPPLPPPPPPRTLSIEQDEAQNIYQEIDNTSTDDDQATTPNADLQFIRGTIKRVFDFHAGSTSESSTNYDEISEDNKNDPKSISSTSSSKTVSKKDTQYPSVEAVQRFYHTKSPSTSEKNNPKQQITNLDDAPSSNHSSTSNKLYARSHPVNARKKDLSKSKSSDNEQASSEEVDDTLNDIEDDDYQDEKLKRQAINNRSGHTSNENSPSHSSDNQIKTKKASQETQTSQRQKPILVTTQSPQGSRSTIQSYETAHSSVPSIDIVTEMVIERNDSVDDGQIGEISGDMIIYYDDIEIVEHSSNVSSTESDTTTSRTKSLQKSKPVQTIIESNPPPPPIPARTLKPLHLLDNQQQPSPATSRNQSSSKVNRIYELEKSTPIRKKVDVNSVNDMLNRTDYFVGPTVTHRHPSARHFVGKLNSDDTSSRHSTITNPNNIPKPSSTMVKSQTLPLQPVLTNGHSLNNNQRSPTKSSFSTLPTRSSSTVGTDEKHRSVIADTNALVKQIQNSLSRNSLHDSQINSPLSISTKDLRTFVSSTYSPSDENMIDDDGIIHSKQQSSSYDDQAFKRQARLSKSFHNVSEYNCIDQYPKQENGFTSRTQPSKSVENNLNRVSQNQIRNIPVNFPPVVASTSFSALPHSEDNARMLSMKWYTGQVSENSEICYNTPHIDNDDLLYGYISAHGNRDTQLLLARLQASNDIRIHAALDDIRLRVAQFDASKSPEDLHVFMRYLESRLRDISNKNSSSSTTTTTTTTSNHVNGQRRISNGGTTNGYHIQHQQSDSISIKSRTSSIATGAGKDTPPTRQLGRQHLRSSGNITEGGGTNGHQPVPPPRRGSQSSVNQENPAVFDDMLNTVLGLPKKGVSTLPQTYVSSSQSREKLTPLTQAQISTNTTGVNKTGRDVGKRLFESGTYKDPRLLYDGPKKTEKEEQPLETSV